RLGGAPWLPVEGHPPGRGTEAQRGEAQSRRLLDVPRAGHRHRVHRPRRPDRLAEVRREGTAADRAGGPCIWRDRDRPDDRLRTVGPDGVCDPGEGRLRQPDRSGGDPSQSARRARPGARGDVPREALGRRRGVRTRAAIVSVPRSHEEGLPRGARLPVLPYSGHKPTVPSWTGEMLPRSFDLSIAVGEFRRDLAAKIAKDGEAAAKEWLQQEYRTDTGSAQSLVSYVQEQVALIPDLPTDRRVL